MICTLSADRRHMRPVGFPLGGREDINVMPLLVTSIVKIITGGGGCGEP
jgi:hypothetical protein